MPIIAYIIIIIMTIITIFYHHIKQWETIHKTRNGWRRGNFAYIYYPRLDANVKRIMLFEFISFHYIIQDQDQIQFFFYFLHISPQTYNKRVKRIKNYISFYFSFSSWACCAQFNKFTTQNTLHINTYSYDK